jgi:hypothetical protein
MLCIQICISQMLVVSMDMELGTKQHGSKRFQNVDDAEQLFFLSSTIVALSQSKLAKVVGDGTAILHDCSSQLIIRGIGVKGQERQFMIGVSKKGVGGNQGFHLAKRFVIQKDPSQQSMRLVQQAHENNEATCHDSSS